MATMGFVSMNMLSYLALLAAFPTFVVAKPGANCTDAANCGDWEVCSPDHHVCNCDKEHYLSEERVECMAYSGMLRPCIESRQCENYSHIGAECREGLCQCPMGKHYRMYSCWITKAFGQRCKLDYECYAMPHLQAAMCAKGICTCDAAGGYRPSEDKTDCEFSGQPCNLHSPLVIILNAIAIAYLNVK